ncbi:hypothetical protein L2755_21935 [Shewanella abyssi]|uniref:hypothetical protein n=1 Tax=Shewanella abyssi TaxID=311789 RepID=UPI00200DE169|nr:hypothetical protein [Shewanella abyssi]MCL1052244.1 hypothetical protein [Shewanella abyssi]
MKTTAIMGTTDNNNLERKFYVSTNYDIQSCPECKIHFGHFINRLSDRLGSLSRAEFLSCIASSPEYFHENLRFNACTDNGEVELITTGKQPVCIDRKSYEIDYYVDLPTEGLKLLFCGFKVFMVDVRLEQLHMADWY